MRFVDWIQGDDCPDAAQLQHFSPDRLELVEAFDSAVLGHSLECVPMGRSRGTTTIVINGLRWLAKFRLARYAVFIGASLDAGKFVQSQVRAECEPECKRSADELYVHGLGPRSSMHGLIVKGVRPDFVIVDAFPAFTSHRTYSFEGARRQVAMMRRVADLAGPGKAIRGVVIN